MNFSELLAEHIVPFLKGVGIGLFVGAGVVLAVSIVIILIRTLRFRPQKIEPKQFDKVTLDGDAAVEKLAALVRCKTVSNRDAALEDDAEFEKLVELLPTLYPNVAATCAFSRFEGRGLLFHWKGKHADAPAVLMAHYDVVPADEEYWEKPPFAAVLENGVLWGRGTLDTKVTMNAALFAADKLIATGFVPENDVYFAFSGGEEVNGMGASHIVSYFEEKGIVPGIVLDEGGAVVENVFPGVSAPCGMVGIAEKGMLNLEFSVKSAGGHADFKVGHLEREDLHLIYINECLLQLHLLARTCKLVCAHTLDLLGRVDGGSLQTLARKVAEHLLNPFACDVVGGVAAVDGVLHIVTRSCRAEFNVGDILLLLGLQGVDHLRGLAYADDEHSRSKRVECAGVTDLYLLVA